MCSAAELLSLSSLPLSFCSLPHSLTLSLSLSHKPKGKPLALVIVLFFVAFVLSFLWLLMPFEFLIAMLTGLVFCGAYKRKQ